MEIQLYESEGQMSLLCPECEKEQRRKKRTPAPKRQDDLVAVPYLYLDMTPGHCDLLGEHRWEMRSPWREGRRIRNTGVAPRKPVRASLAEVLQKDPQSKYFLSTRACLGILRRAKERGKELPEQLKMALMVQAGLIPPQPPAGQLKAYHINQRDEGIDLNGVSGALMATSNMQMQTFVTGQQIAFAANQRDELRDLHDVAGALGAQPGMKQQTFIASFSAGAGAKAGSISYSERIAPTLKAAPSGNSMPSVLCLNDQGGERMDVTIEQTTTLRAQAGGHQPLICLNDQGGGVMACTENLTGTLRAQEHGHQPLVFNVHGQDSRYEGPTETAQTVTAAFGMGGGNTPLIKAIPEKSQQALYENHGIDARYTGPHDVAPTMSARYGTGGNNVPLVEQKPNVYCITGNAIDRQPQNGGNGIGYQEDIAYTLTATDHHAVFSRQRVDVFKDDDVVSTQSARQHKDATDLVYQETVGALTSSDSKGPNSQYVGQDKLVLSTPQLIRRLTPLECERLQGFPDGWTDLTGASDAARYKALGNSVAMPCVMFVMRGIAAVLYMAMVERKFDEYRNEVDNRR